MMLAGMIAASANMVEKSRKAFDTYYDANNVLTAHGGGDDVGAAVVTVDEPGGATYTTAITYHVNDNAPARADKPIISYEVK